MRFLKSKKKTNKVLGIVARSKPELHYEVHFDECVEFWTLNGKCLGESKVEAVD